MRAAGMLPALLGAVLLCQPGAATAHPRVTLAPAVGPASASPVLRGAGFRPHAQAVVRLGSRVLVRTVADRDGRFRVKLALPRSPAGRLLRLRLAPVRGLVTVFRIDPRVGRLPVNEVAAPGARMRWSPPSGRVGTRIRISALGPALRHRALISLGRAARSVPLERGRRLTTSVVVRSGNGSRRRGLLRSGHVRLPFHFRVLATSEPPGGGPTPDHPTPPGGPSQPSLPVRAVFYYPWFPEAWRQGGLEPFTWFHPSLGYYDSGSESVIRRHLAAMDFAHVDVGISSWWGQGRTTDARLGTLLGATRANSSSIHWAIYYEQEGSADGNGPDPTDEQLRADLLYLRDRHARDPAYFRIGGRFVVFVWGDSADGCPTAERWSRASAGIDVYVVLKVFSGYRDCPSQPDAWHQYAAAVAEDHQEGQSFSISPGFHKATESAPRLARDAARWAESVRRMDASGEPFQLITTFNEWGEGTAVESADEWASPSGFGLYLDALHAQP